MQPQLVLVESLWRSVWVTEEQLDRALEEQERERVRLQQRSRQDDSPAEEEPAPLAQRSRFDPDRVQFRLAATANQLREELEKASTGPLRRALQWLQRYDKGHDG